MATINTPGAPASLPSPTVPRFPRNAIAVTPHNTDQFSCAVTIHVGGGGDVTVRPAGGQAAVKFVVPAGGVVPCEVLGVDATGTTATNMVAVY